MQEMLYKMSENQENQEEQERINEYLKSIQDQVLAIINGVKEEEGIDTPLEIEVKEVNPDD